MTPRIVRSINKKFNVKYTYYQLSTLVIVFKSRNINIRGRLELLIKNRIKHKCDVGDFYNIKKILIDSLIEIPNVQNEDRFIRRYGITKGKKLYKSYCKNKTRNWQPENPDFVSLEFHIKKYGKELGKIKYKERCYNVGKATRVEYYLNQGYSKEESERLLKERQTTFSLEICIKKHGKTKGTEIWQARQDKWQNTLNSKPQEEIDEINKRKSYGKRCEWNIETPGMIYYIKFFNDETEFFKIGITTKNLIGERFENPELFKKKYNLYYEVLFQKNMPIYDCFDLEQRILNKYNNHRIHTNYNGFTTTETFDRNVLKEFLK